MKKPTIEFEFTCGESLDKNDFCHKCQHHVVDLSKLTASEIDKVLERKDICVTAYYDQNDQLITRSQPGRTFWQRFAVGASLVTLLGCEPAVEKAEVEKVAPSDQIAMATPPTVEAPKPFVHNHTQATDLELDERCGEYVYSDQTSFERIQAARNVRDGNVQKGTDLDAMSTEALADEWAYEQTVELGTAYREVFRTKPLEPVAYKKRLRGKIVVTNKNSY